MVKIAPAQVAAIDVVVDFIKADGQVPRHPDPDE
jgi:hypothetical protein